MNQQNGVDAVMMAVQAISAMEIMVAKEIPVNKAKMINIGSIHGGKVNNIICDYVEIFGSCRAAEDAVSDQMEERIQQICQSVATCCGGRAEYERVKLLPYRVNHPVLYQKLYESAAKRLGADKIHRPTRSLGGEDFGYLSRLKPCCYMLFGIRPVGVPKVSPVHTNTFDIDPDSYAAPIEVMTGFVFDHMDGIDFGG